MKTIKFTLITAVLILALTTSASAQGKYGANPQDSVTCIQNLNFIKEEMKTENYQAAYSMYSTIMRVCPNASQNTYLYGINIMKYFAGKENDQVQKQKYVDTIFMLYDRRYEIFGKPSKGETATRKAEDLNTYRPDQHSEIIKEYEIAAINNYKSPEAYVEIMQQVKIMYEKKLIDGDAIIARYESIVKAIDNLPPSPETEEARKTVEGIFLSMPELNSCENLIAMYTPKFQANPEDMDLIRGIRYRLSNTEGCRETQLFADVVEAGYRLEPNAESAFQLAQLFLIKGDKEKGMSYMNEAIEQETDKIQKAKYQLQVASVLFNDGRISQALSLARQANSLNPNAGEAYMIMGNCYVRMAANASDCEFGGREIFWIVVDMFQKAKSVDSKLASSANSAIATYVKLFPLYKDIFFYGYSEGDSYTVRCNGVSGTTTIRKAAE